MRSLLIVAAVASIMILPALAAQQEAPITRLQGHEALRDLVDMGYSSRRDDEHYVEGLQVPPKLPADTSLPKVAVGPSK